MKLGIIGIGNMAQAMLSRWLEHGVIEPSSVWISDINGPRCQSLASQWGVQVAGDNHSLVQMVETLLIAVKPNQVDKVLAEIQPFAAGKNVLSIVTGLSTERMQQMLPGAKVARIMPNTPALVGEGALVISQDHTLTDAALQWTQAAFAKLGKVFFLEEKYFDAVVGVSGSAPAYVFVMIEAMADAGVMNGLPRDIAYQLVAQTLLGAAKMVQESGQHPGSLKDAVCSPGGTTIEAIYSLERSGFRGALMEAIQVCTEKAAALRRGQE